MDFEKILRLAQNARADAEKHYAHCNPKDRRSAAARYFVADLSNEIARDYGFVAEETFLRALGFEHLMEP